MKIQKNLSAKVCLLKNMVHNQSHSTLTKKLDKHACVCLDFSRKYIFKIIFRFPWVLCQMSKIQGQRGTKMAA